MSNEVLILLLEAMIMYFLVLASHSLRHRFGPVHFYALIGGVTAIMSWITDAGLVVTLGDITFVVGSTVFYTALLLGVFVVYVFDGPRATRITISTVVGVSIMMPLVAAALHLQAGLIGAEPISSVPLPSLRINTASVVATLLDLIFLGMAWEFLGKPRLGMGLWIRTWLTLLSVMWLDVLLFATGAFAGTPGYLSIMEGTLISRFIISLIALPFLYGYLYWQSNIRGEPLENRPVLAILRQVAEIEAELTEAQREIERRKRAERALQEANARLIQQERLAAVGQLTTGLAHVFNNILASLMLRTQMALKSSGDERDRHLRIVHEQLKEAAALVGKLLDFSRKGLMRRERVALAPFLQEQVARLREILPPGVTLHLDAPDGRCEVQADRGRLEEVVHNLVRNAQDAVGRQGAIRITLRSGPAQVAAQAKEVRCSVCHRRIEGVWVQISVADDGEGITTTDGVHIFEPFFTTRGPQRRGLGLSQVLGIVKQHGGHVAISSDGVKGATATIYLPPHVSGGAG